MKEKFKLAMKIFIEEKTRMTMYRALKPQSKEEIINITTKYLTRYDILEDDSRKIAVMMFDSILQKDIEIAKVIFETAKKEYKK